MPRLHPLPPPEVEALERLPLHVLIRDWPELLEVLREGGVDPAADGGVSMSERGEGAPRPAVEALLRATAWREVPLRASGGPGGEG